MSKKCEKALGIYIHIPWCIKKCPYCAFNSTPQAYVDREYVDSLIKEAQWVNALFHLSGRTLKSVYFGGGTPSLLSPAEVERVLTFIDSSHQLKIEREVTLEVNPATNEGEKLKAFRKAGINRLSIGVQSFDDYNLDFLGRLHSAGAAKKTFSDARGAGFDNISLDLMFALPRQKKKQLLSDLEVATSLEPEHISLYLLTMEEGTPMNKSAERRAFRPASDLRQEELFLFATDYLATRGYVRYETSNYAREGFHSMHNMSYWQGGDYIGLGAGAHSYLSDPGWGLRWWNLADAGEYESRLREGLMPLESLEILGRDDALREIILTSLRTNEGLREARLRERFGLSLSEALSMAKLSQLPHDLYRLDREALRLTDSGALLADDIAERISL